MRKKKHKYITEFASVLENPENRAQYYHIDGVSPSGARLVFVFSGPIIQLIETIEASGCPFKVYKANGWGLNTRKEKIYEKTSSISSD